MIKSASQQSFFFGQNGEKLFASLCNFMCTCACNCLYMYLEKHVFVCMRILLLALCLGGGRGGGGGGKVGRNEQMTWDFTSF